MSKPITIETELSREPMSVARDFQALMKRIWPNVDGDYTSRVVSIKNKTELNYLLTLLLKQLNITDNYTTKHIYQLESKVKDLEQRIEELKGYNKQLLYIIETQIRLDPIKEKLNSAPQNHKTQAPYKTAPFKPL